MTNEQAERTRLTQLGTPQAVIDEMMALRDHLQVVTRQRDQARYIVSITRSCKADWMRGSLIG